MLLHWQWNRFAKLKKSMWEGVFFHKQQITAANTRPTLLRCAAQRVMDFRCTVVNRKKSGDKGDKVTNWTDEYACVRAQWAQFLFGYNCGLEKSTELITINHCLGTAFCQMQASKHRIFSAFRKEGEKKKNCVAFVHLCTSWLCKQQKTSIDLVSGNPMAAFSTPPLGQFRHS